MNIKERKDAINYIINLKESKLLKNGKKKNRENLIKWRILLDKILEQKVNKESSEYRNELINFSDKKLNRIKEDLYEEEFFSKNDPYDYDSYFYDDPDDLFD